MTTESFIPVTPGEGINLDTVKVTTSQGVVEREGVFIGDASDGGSRAGVNSSGELYVTDDAAGNLLRRILQMLLAPLGYDKSLQRQRGTVLIESGTVTTVTTVTTCATLTNQTNFGGMNADMLVRAQVNSTWGANVRSRIT